jgi:hypothetical protein
MLQNMDPGLMHKYGNFSGYHFQRPDQPGILYQ